MWYKHWPYFFIKYQINKAGFSGLLYFANSSPPIATEMLSSRPQTVAGTILSGG
jgi:hypothetical protein